jgi:serine/threonine protein kinase
MGIVFLAEHRLLGRRVALKVMHPELAVKSTLVQRFLREVFAVAWLRHPNIVTIYDAELTQDAVFFVMEHLHGRNLRMFTTARMPNDQTQVCTIVYQAALALRHAHKRGVVHRDIKPANLFFAALDPEDFEGTEDYLDRGKIKLLDFGLAKLIKEDLWKLDPSKPKPGFTTPEGYEMGTPGYMPPEQQTDARTAGIQSDIFGLGRTLYALLAGRTPYPMETSSWREEHDGKDPVIPLKEICPHLPAGLIDLVEQMTAKRFEDRVQSCDEVLTALAPWCQTTSPGAAVSYLSPSP